MSIVSSGVFRGGAEPFRITMICSPLGIRAGILVVLALFGKVSLSAKTPFRALDLAAWGVAGAARQNSDGDIIGVSSDSKQGLILHRQPTSEPTYAIEVFRAPSGFSFTEGSSNRHDLAVFSLSPENGLKRDAWVVWPNRTTVRLNELLAQAQSLFAPMPLTVGEVQDQGLFTVSPSFTSNLTTILQLDAHSNQLVALESRPNIPAARALNSRGHLVHDYGIEAASYEIARHDPVGVSFSTDYYWSASALNDSDVAVAFRGRWAGLTPPTSAAPRSNVGVVIGVLGSHDMPTRGEYSAFPIDINDYQEVVGSWQRQRKTEDGGEAPESEGFFLWRAGVLHDLDATKILEGTIYDALTSITSINNRGEILARARRKDGTGEGSVLLAPQRLEASPGLSNLSSRNRVDASQSVTIIGFTVTGDQPVRALIRAVGQGLRPFGVSDPLANPRLSVYRGNEYIVGNDDWGSGAELTRQTARSGAFPLTPKDPARPNEGFDAALLVALEPGSYTVHASAFDPEDRGTVLVEVYVLP